MVDILAYTTMLNSLRHGLCSDNRICYSREDKIKIVKLLAKIQTVPVSAEDKDFRKILNTLSPQDKRVVYLERIKYIFETVMEKFLWNRANDLNHRKKQGDTSITFENLGDIWDDYYELSLKFDNNLLKNIEPEEFNQILAEFIRLVPICLECLNSENKKQLINLLQIQKAEVISVNEQEQKRLFLKGLISGIFGTVAVGLIATQGGMVFLPVIFLIGAHLVLVSDLGFENYLDSYENFFINMIKISPYILYCVIDDLIRFKNNPSLFMDNVLHGVIMTGGVAITATIAAIPPRYFLNQYKQSCKNTEMMDKLFDNEEINQKLSVHTQKSHGMCGLI
jgi:hypothetical protein